jgi:hypothetical protein
MPIDGLELLERDFTGMAVHVTDVNGAGEMLAGYGLLAPQGVPSDSDSP